MPSLNNVSYNSARVQRAYRINNIETLKLNNRIQLLEKEQIHRQRLSNRDIRLISLTLDYIQTSSGHSLEGLAPERESNTRIDYDDDKKDDGPCFLYGERIVSRKRRRTIRPQSALDKSSMSRHTSETASVVSASDISIRPQSSPVRTLNKPFVTQLKDAESEFGYNPSESTGSGATTPRFKPAWVDDSPSDVTKILLRAASTDSNKKLSFFERTKRERGGEQGGIKVLSRSMRIKSRSASERQNSLSGRSMDVGEQDSSPIGRSGRITDILNNGKAPMSASYWKSHLNKSHSSPVTSSKQKQYAMDSKKYMERSRTEIVDLKVKHFMSS